MAITRRAVLAGAAGTGVLGTGGWAADHAFPGVRRRLLGSCGGPGAPAGGAVVSRATFASRAMAGDVRYAVSRPPGHSADPLPVAIALHGRGGNADNVIGMGFGEFAAEAVARGTAAPFALAAVDGGLSSYWHKRSSGIDPLTMVLDEFVPLLLSRHGLGGGKSATAVIGWSMGGYGALLAAETAPEVFGAVVAASPAVWWTYAGALHAHSDTFDGAADWAAHDVTGHLALLTSAPVRIDCGDLDPFAPAARRILEALPKAEGGIAPGCHDDAFWRSVAPQQVAFLSQHLRPAG